MKLMNKIVIGLLITTMLISTFNLQYTVAAPDKKVEISGDKVQENIRANEQTRFRFRERTQLTLQCDEDCNASIDCDAQNIGDKDFEIDIDADEEINLTMKCVEEEKELGLQKGNTFQVRNRNRYRYQEGFCVELKASGDVKAQLKLQATSENQNGQWAYYDDDEEEWVTVETTVEDGYLVAETDHFSTWTVLVPEIDLTLLLVGIGIGAVVIVAVVVIFMKRRK